MQKNEEFIENLTKEYSSELERKSLNFNIIMNARKIIYGYQDLQNIIIDEIEFTKHNTQKIELT